MTSLGQLRRFAIYGFVALNVAGLLYAVRMGEGGHATVHLLALMVFATVCLVKRLATRTPRVEELPVPSPTEPDVLDRLQQSVDSIALEVERIGEGQRFNARLLQERKVSNQAG